ncbi:MAG: phospholipase D family protein, partial [Nanoarchaeota archaeon]|nr:phospholipase D family protein [Nanoarchaeota archaeon]
MIDYYAINSELKNSFKLNQEYVIEDIISVLASFNPINVKSVLTQGIMNNHYQLITTKSPFTKSIIMIVSHQEYPEQQIDVKHSNIVLSIPPYHKSTMGVKLERSKINYVSLYDSFVDLIKSAKETIFICSPFFDLKDLMEIQNILIRKATEGVIINILTRNMDTAAKDRTPRTKSLIRFKSRLVTERSQTNIQIKDYHFEGENSTVLSSIHSKLLIIDSSRAYIGSGEFRRNSFDRNFEVGIIINNKETINDLKI